MSFRHYFVELKKMSIKIYLVYEIFTFSARAISMIATWVHLHPPSPFVLPVAQWHPLSLIPYFPNQNICRLLQFSKEFHLK